MLHNFLTSNRHELIDLCRERVSKRRAPRPTPGELEYGIPLFLEQLTEMMPGKRTDPAENPRATWERAARAQTRIDEGATKHGSELLRHEFPIDQVVLDYGDLCQSITDLAFRQDVAISVEDFGHLNMRLDHAIAGAVTEYSKQREVITTQEGGADASARLAQLAHEMRNLLNTSILALSAIKGGGVGFGGATAAALDRSLISMRGLIDRTLAKVRIDSGSSPAREVIEVGPFMLEMQVAAALEASVRGCDLTVLPVAPGIFVEADRHILAAAVTNLLQNAFKFTRSETHVLLRAHASQGRVLIEVEDECGGLPQGIIEEFFRPFRKRDGDDGAVGLGLALSRKAISINGGQLYVKNIPAKGCVFTIDLPQKAA